MSMREREVGTGGREDLEFETKWEKKGGLSADTKRNEDAVKPNGKRRRRETGLRFPALHRERERVPTKVGGLSNCSNRASGNGVEEEDLPPSLHTHAAP